MKLILSLNLNGNRTVNIDILKGTIEEIDRFTTCFVNRNELFSKIIKSEINQDIISDFSKYDIFIKTRNNNLVPVLYSDYSFITNSLKRRNASIKLMHMDINRIYDYIEKNCSQFMIDEFEEENKQIYKYDNIYGLYKIVSKEDFKVDAYYYNYFKINIESNYRTLRELLRCILSKEELKEFGKIKSMSQSMIDVITEKVLLEIKKIEKEESKVSYENDDIDVEDKFYDEKQYKLVMNDWEQLDD